jgi:hypothetical protein
MTGGKRNYKPTGCQPVPHLRRSEVFRIHVPVLPDWADLWRAGPFDCAQGRLSGPQRPLECEGGSSSRSHF